MLPYTPQTFRPLTFHDAVPRFRDGSDTPRAYLERCLATIAEREPEVMAFAHLNEDGARAAADASTARYRAGAPLADRRAADRDQGPDRDARHANRDGQRLLQGEPARADSALVQALREAGAVIVGKTVTTELGMSHPGPTRLPFDTRRTPGGSSSGSGAVISARMLPAAIGTQVLGSVIRPASFNANWALKPTQGGINRGERQGFSQSTVGIHAGCGEDMWAIAVEIVKRVGGDPGAPGLYFTREDAPAPVVPRRLAVLETEGWAVAEPAAIAAFEQALDALRAQGVAILRRGDHPLLEALEQRVMGAMGLATDVCAYESAWSVANMMAKNPDALSASLKARFELGCFRHAAAVPDAPAAARGDAPRPGGAGRRGRCLHRPARLRPRAAAGRHRRVDEPHPAHHRQSHHEHGVLGPRLPGGDGAAHGGRWAAARHRRDHPAAPGRARGGDCALDRNRGSADHGLNATGGTP